MLGIPQGPELLCVKQARTPENIGGLRLSHRRAYRMPLHDARRRLVGTRTRVLTRTSYVSHYALALRAPEVQPLINPPGAMLWTS